MSNQPVKKLDSDQIDVNIQDVLDRTSAEMVIFATQPLSTEETMVLLVDNNIPFKVLLGSYKGDKETAFITPFMFFKQIIDLGLLDEQESVLTLSNLQQNGHRIADLVYTEVTQDDKVRIETLGQFAPIGDMSLEVLPESYTFDPSSGLYFGTVELPALEAPKQEEANEDSQELSGS